MPLPSVSVRIETATKTEPVPIKAADETPFRVLLVADFSGRGSRGEPAPGRWTPFLIDRDNFDEVLSRFRPELTLGSGEATISLQFRELDDFSPDRIYIGNPAFERFRALRDRLLDPSSFAEAAAELTGGGARTGAAPALPKSPVAAASAAGSLLDRVLDAEESGTAAIPAGSYGDLQEFIDQAVRPHLEPRSDPRLPELLAAVDEGAARVMRAILHDPNFQALEAAWRAVFWLVRRLETGPQLKLYVADMAKADLAEELETTKDPETAPFYQLLAGHSDPWAVVAAGFTFSRMETDARLLRQIAATSMAANAPFLAEAGISDFDTGEAERLWNQLRQAPEAPWIGLLLPRFLLRLPYGPETASIESFPFSEMPDTPEHSHYLWGNPAFACAYLLGQDFLENGWNMRPGSHNRIDGLPVHVYEEDGEHRAKPCAEILMTESEAEWVIDQGFMPLVSVKGQDSVQLPRMQSIADPTAPLAGRWAE